MGCEVLQFALQLYGKMLAGVEKWPSHAAHFEKPTSSIPAPTGSKPLVKARGRAAGETDGPGADRGGARGPRVSGQLEIASQSERMLPHFSSWVSRRVQWNHVCAQMCPACH
jgi:hypothetical protein